MTENERMTPYARIVQKEPPFLTYDLFDDIDFCIAGCSTRFGGVSKDCFTSMNLGFDRGDPDENVMENFRLLGKSAGFSLESVCLPNQCHTKELRIVTDKERGSGITGPKPEEPIDAQITNVPNITLICYGADCVPVYFCDPVKKVIGLAHAGWKGTILNIVGQVVSAMQEEYGCSPEDLRCLIGPSICQDCYEVGFDVAEAFLSRYPGSDIVKNLENGKYLLGLWEANRKNLLESGVRESHIVKSGVCTKCNPETFFSHRVHKDKRGANAAFMMIREA